VYIQPVSRRHLEEKSRQQKTPALGAGAFEILVDSRLFNFEGVSKLGGDRGLKLLTE
jgi:hypothetical protein